MVSREMDIALMKQSWLRGSLPAHEAAGTHPSSLAAHQIRVGGGLRVRHSMVDDVIRPGKLGHGVGIDLGEDKKEIGCIGAPRKL